ncbi:MAG: hypothetical protein QXY92_03420 [Archaeoglobaceae archaeon]
MRPKNTNKFLGSLQSSQLLYKIGKDGKIYVPKYIREIFRGHYFYLTIENGKLVYDPVKIEEDI